MPLGWVRELSFRFRQKPLALSLTWLCRLSAQISSSLCRSLKMRIAQIAPLFESVPPKLYGGTERVVHALVEELVRRGHEVTLFASGDSETSAKLVPIVGRALRLDKEVLDTLPYQVLQLTKAFSKASEFDLIHSHVDYLAFPFARFIETPMVTTLHGRLDLLDLQALYDEFTDMPLVSISNNQRRPLPQGNWLATVYNGIEMEHFKFERRRGDYLAFLGRISPEKRVDKAIEVARRTGIPLKIAAKVDKVDRDYYEALIKPLIEPPLIEYLGEIAEHEKSEFLGKAYALIFPVDWPEPFGLAMAEAMACGTPVIARRVGSIPEIVVDGRTGFICDSVEEMILATRRIPDLNPQWCREHVESHFSAQAMATGYEAAYRLLLEHPERAMVVQKKAVLAGLPPRPPSLPSVPDNAHVKKAREKAS